MKHKKLVYSFLIFSISLFSFLPVLNLFFTYTNAKISQKSFTKQALFSTDNIEAIQNYFAYKLFNVSLNGTQAVLGKDDFFFLGDMFRNVISKGKGSFYSDKQIDTWTSQLKKLQEWYEQQGIEFVLVIAPNKHTVYSDKLPNGIQYKEGKTTTDDIVKSALDKHIHILNLKEPLRNKKDKQLYFKMDTHWNRYGALVGYLATMKYLNDTYKKNYHIPEFTMKKVVSSGGGDLTNFLRINHFLSHKPKINYYFQFKKKSKICYGEISRNSNVLKKCTISGIKKDKNQYAINDNADNGEKLLYLQDSFGMANTQLYQKTFSTVWRFHLSYVNGKMLKNFIQAHRPDIVIYQIVERDLGNNTIIDDLPKRVK